MLRKLGAERCALKLCGYRQPEEFPSPDKQYDFRAWPSPYTKGAGNLHAYYMLILQDWSSEQKLLQQGWNEDVANLGRDPELMTNQRLTALLASVCQLTLADVYATNAFPLVKTGSISAPIPRRRITEVAQKILRREWEIVTPVRVLALGRMAAHAARSIGIEFTELPHPARRGMGLDEMTKVWRVALEAGSPA